MKNLNFELSRLTKRTRQGSRATQANRHSLLQKSANDLHDLGYKLNSAKNLKRKHIDALVTHWQGQGLAANTLKNRLSALRWLSETLGKTGLLPAENRELGVSTIGSVRKDRAKLATAEQLAGLSDPHIGLAVRMQMAFGLRAEEALKLRPQLADRGSALHLQASWCKGGRERAIPIETEYQRKLLDLAKVIAKDGSLIPSGRSYKQQRDRYYYQTRKVGLTNPHGLRHAYAQERYIEMTGFKPAALGGLRWHQLTDHQRLLDRNARHTISRELGHNRIGVTNVYLGGAR
ncbi:phage integrase N-terminal domain-containing protein [Pacificispira sp.]|uniref:phage integrase N-terminal domain-containing protein n=1 Tax=Pacificispira sp. TaxID=2888761 RepID=UPI003B51A014